MFTDYGIKVYEVKTQDETIHIWMKKGNIIEVFINNNSPKFEAKELTYLSLIPKIKYILSDLNWLISRKIKTIFR